MTNLQGMLHFTRNAYRILGVLGNSSQDAITHAADVMDASLKMGVSSTTSWDMPWLGNLPRSEAEVRDAMGRLNDPNQRLRERLFWFHEGETLLKGLNRETIGEIAAKWAEMDRPAARHDSTLLKVVGAIILDPKFEDNKRWLEAINLCKQLVESDEYWKLLADLEKATVFDPHATPEQIESLRAETLKLVVDAISGHALEVAAALDKTAVRRALKIFKMAGLPVELMSVVETEVMGPMEDDFYALCSEIRRKCDDNVKKDGKYAEENQRVCRDALMRFNSEIEPALAVIIELSGKDSLAARRARERAAFCLHGLALDHVWAEEYDTSEKLIAKAKEMAPSDSLILSRIQETVSSLTENARGKKHSPQAEPVIKLEPPSSGAGSRILQGLIAVLVVVVAVGIYLNLKGTSTEEQVARMQPSEKQDATSDTVPGGKDDLVARVIKDSAQVSAPPSPRDNNLKPSKEGRQTAMRTPEVTVARTTQTTTAITTTTVTTLPKASVKTTTTVLVKQAPASTQKVVTATAPPAPSQPQRSMVAKGPEHAPTTTRPAAATTTTATRPASAPQKMAAVHRPADEVVPVKKPVQLKESALKVPSVTKGDKKAARTRSAGGDKETLKSLESQITSGEVVLSRLEAKLETLLKDLEPMEQRAAGYRSSIDAYERQIKQGAQIDTEKYQRTVEEYNGFVRDYNKRLAEARQTAAEHESLLKQQRKLTERRQSLSVR